MLLIFWVSFLIIQAWVLSFHQYIISYYLISFSLIQAYLINLVLMHLRNLFALICHYNLMAMS